MKSPAFVYFKRVAFSVSLPVVLVILFVLENDFFNSLVSNFIDENATERQLASFATGVLFYCPAIFIRKKWRYPYLMTVAIFTSLIFIAQLISFKVFGTFLYISALKYAWMAGMVTDSIRAFLDVRIFFFFLPIAAIVSVWFLLRRKDGLYTPTSRRDIFVALYLLVMALVGGYGSYIKSERLGLANLRLDCNQVFTSEKMGIINYSLKSTVMYLSHDRVPTGQDRALIKKEFAATSSYKPGQKHQGIAKGRDLILIEVESLENAVINRKIDGQEITPELNKIAAEGVYLSNYYSQVGPGTTADAEFSVLNSLYPLPDDVAFINYVANNYRALPSLLKTKGYHTDVFDGNIPSFWNRANMYPGLGFDKMFTNDSYKVGRPVGTWRLSDPDFLSQTTQKLERLPQPFMAFMYTMSSHLPCNLPQDLRTLSVPPQMQCSDLQRQYLQVIHYTDQALGDFVRRLKSEPWYGNSLIVIYGDHGVGLDIAGKLGSDKQIPPGLDRENVPLIILAPGLDLKGEFKQPASHIDLYPTIANLLGVAYPPGLLGRDIFNNPDPIAVHRNGSGMVDAAMSSGTVYVASADGAFEHSSCSTWPKRNPLPVNDCRDLYDQASLQVQASDIAVRKNLIPLLVGTP